MMTTTRTSYAEALQSLAAGEPIDGDTLRRLPALPRRDSYEAGRQYEAAKVFCWVLGGAVALAEMATGEKFIDIAEAFGFAHGAGFNLAADQNIRAAIWEIGAAADFAAGLAANSD